MGEEMRQGRAYSCFRTCAGGACGSFTQGGNLWKRRSLQGPYHTMRSDFLLELHQIELEIFTWKGWRRFVSGFLALVVLAVSLHVQAQQTKGQEDVGYVLEKTGEWLLEGKTPKEIYVGQRLSAGRSVRYQSPGMGYGSITIVLYGSIKPISRQCRIPGSCIFPIRLPDQIVVESSIHTRIIEEIKRFFIKEPSRYISAISRTLQGNLKEAVIKLNDKNVDLSLVFSGMVTGLYLIRLQPILPADKAENKTSLGPIRVNWEQYKPLVIEIKGLEPGLYRVNLLKAHANEYEPIGSDAWILICKPEKYEETNMYFQEAIQLVKGWPNEVKTSAIQSFLRAYLDHLSLQAMK